MTSGSSTNELKNKERCIFTPQLLQGFWYKRERIRRSLGCPRQLLRRATSNKKLFGSNTICCMAVAEHHILGGKHFLILGPESGGIWRLKWVQKLQKKYHCQWILLRGKNPKWIFHIFLDLFRPSESIPVSLERVVPTKWQVRAILGDCTSKARVITVPAPQYRQQALISDFLDLANLSVQEEAAVATNWSDDRPEGLRPQNLALATMAGPVMSSLLKYLTADVQHAIDKCESFGPGQQLILQGNPSAIAAIFPSHMAVLRRHVLPHVHFQCCMLLQGTLGGDF